MGLPPFCREVDFGLALPPGVRALQTLRGPGCSPAPYDDGSAGPGFNLATHVGDQAQYVAANRAALQTLLPGAPLWLEQVHGSLVLDAGGLYAQPPAADASVSAQARTVCVVMTADCLPVLFCAADGSVVAAAHAGWRGLAGGVLQNTVAEMRARGAGEIYAWLGPAIGPHKFQVGLDVRTAFASLYGADQTLRDQLFVADKTAGGDKFLADIFALARLALATVGVVQVGGGGECTVSLPQQYFSYRREHCTGRMASLIWRDA